MVNRTKQPEGCIGVSEKCVFAWKSLSSRYREQLKCFFSSCSFTSTLCELNKLAFETLLHKPYLLLVFPSLQVNFIFVLALASCIL